MITFWYYHTTDQTANSHGGDGRRLLSVTCAAAPSPHSHPLVFGNVLAT